MFALLRALVKTLVSSFETPRELALENLALRHQRLVLQRKAHDGRRGTGRFGGGYEACGTTGNTRGTSHGTGIITGSGSPRNSGGAGQGVAAITRSNLADQRPSRTDDEPTGGSPAQRTGRQGAQRTRCGADWPTSARAAEARSVCASVPRGRSADQHQIWPSVFCAITSQDQVCPHRHNAFQLEEVPRARRKQMGSAAQYERGAQRGSKARARAPRRRARR